MKIGYDVRQPVLDGTDFVSWGTFKSRTLAQGVVNTKNDNLTRSPFPQFGIPAVMDMPENADEPQKRMFWVEKIDVPDDFVFMDD